MKLMNHQASSYCLFFGWLLIGLTDRADAAVPVIEMETDPITSLHCAKHPDDEWRASGAITSATSISMNSVSMYQAAFDPTSKSGSLKKYRVMFDRVDDAIKIVPVAEWDAADILTGKITGVAKPAPNARHIYTSTLAANQSLLTIPFLWNDLSQLQRASLNASPVTGIDDQLGEKRLDYIRGGRQYELGNAAGIFPLRNRILGAIVHSAPVFVGAPSARTQGDGYSAFYDANKERRPVIYVGASDGMLHAFDALGGEELFAYIPQALFRNLNNLTKQGGVYRPFVDGEIAVSDARVRNEWKTILASGMGGGAQGVFAIDVTTPDQFEKGLGVLWEFTDADDADMGNVFGAPLIAKFKVKLVKGAPEYREFVVIAGGSNSYRDDGAGKFNLQAPGTLFLLALDKAKSEPWKIGSNYFKFSIPISDKTLANGLTAPALVLADDGAVSYIYSGDLQGNLWRFDFTGSAPWPNAHSGASKQPLFFAMDERGNRQAITQKVQVVYASHGGYMVLFGTGKFMEAADLNSKHFIKQSFYGIFDALDGKTVLRSQLAARKLSQIDSGTSALEISGSDINDGLPTKNDKGWYFDFLESDKTGERSISSAVVRDGNLFFNTLIPNVDPCQKLRGRSYVLNALTGLPAYANLSAYLTSISVLRTPTVMAIVPDQSPRDATGKRQVKKKLEVLDPAADKSGEKARLPKPISETTTTTGRLSWREIVNWVELRTSAVKK